MAHVMDIPEGPAAPMPTTDETPGHTGHGMASSEMIPDFAAHPTITAVRSGPWSSASTWSLGRIPAEGDVVTIGAGKVVQYDVVSSVKLATVAVEAGGQLLFRTNADTRLVAGTFLVLEGGRLEVGTPTQPVAATAEIVIADRALDTSVDPEQFGTGLLVLGKVTMHGAVKEATFARLAVEPKRGDTKLTLAGAVDWHPGDRIVMAPSGGVSMFFEPRSDEELVVAAVAGNTVTLTTPIRGIYEGARDGNGHLDFLPHVGNLSRNVVIRSENPAGTRGHTMFMDRADVDLRYVQFKDLGRTTGEALDSTTFDDHGRVTRVGTNQIARYPLHLHHVLGAPNPTNTGYQFQLIGNVIDGGRKWGLVLHDSHYGLVKDNVVYNLQTAGIVTEEGSESYNVVERNFVTGVDKGDGFWINGARNYFRDNVVGRANTGFWLPPNLNNTLVFAIPPARGDAMRTEPVSWIHSTFLEFARNEAYSVYNGLYLDHRHGGAAQGGHLVKDFRVWSSFGRVHAGVAVSTYDTDGLIIDGLVARGAGIDVSTDKTVVIRNSDIQGADRGIWDRSNGVNLVVENTYLRNDVNVEVRLALLASGGPHGADPTMVRTTTLRDVRYDAPTGKPLVAIKMLYVGGGDSRVPVLGNVVEVYNHNRQANDNFRVYFLEQRPDFVVPFVGDIPDNAALQKIALQEPGLPNHLAWAKYGVAVAGSVAPRDAVTREGVLGLVAPLAAHPGRPAEGHAPAEAPTPRHPEVPEPVHESHPEPQATPQESASPLTQFFFFEDRDNDPMRMAEPVKPAAQPREAKPSSTRPGRAAPLSKWSALRGRVVQPVVKLGGGRRVNAPVAFGTSGIAALPGIEFALRFFDATRE